MKEFEIVGGETVEEVKDKLSNEIDFLLSTIRSHLLLIETRKNQILALSKYHDHVEFEEDMLKD